MPPLSCQESRLVGRPWTRTFGERASDWRSATRVYAFAATVGLGALPQRDCLRDMSAAIGTTIAVSSHDARGTRRNTGAGLALERPKATAP